MVGLSTSEKQGKFTQSRIPTHQKTFFSDIIRETKFDVEVL